MPDTDRVEQIIVHLPLSVDASVAVMHGVSMFYPGAKLGANRDIGDDKLVIDVHPDDHRERARLLPNAEPGSLPMPNDVLPDERVVIASCDQENGQYDVLVLNPDPGTEAQRGAFLDDQRDCGTCGYPGTKAAGYGPCDKCPPATFAGPTEAGYYAVLVLDAATLAVVAERRHPNIIPATEDYADSIGGY